LTGEKGSNTLFLEKVRKWNGLLIEADPENFQVLKIKNRKTFTMHACLNTKPYPAVVGTISLHFLQTNLDNQKSVMP
jgi:hypothetical protein